MFVSMTTVGAAPGANCTAEALAMRLSKCNTLQSAVASELSTDSEKMLHQLCKYVEKGMCCAARDTRMCMLMI